MIASRFVVTLILILMTRCQATISDTEAEDTISDDTATPVFTTLDATSDTVDVEDTVDTVDSNILIPTISNLPPPVKMLADDTELTPDDRKAFASVEREAYFNEAFSSGRKSSHRLEGSCQYTFHVPRGSHCSSRSTEMKLYEMQQTLLSLQSQMQSQRRRLDATDLFLRRFRHVISRRESRPGTSSSSSKIPDPPIHSIKYFNPSPSNDASKALEVLSEDMQVQLSNLEIQIDDAESRRMRLQLRNLNLTRHVQQKQKIINNLTQENSNLAGSVSQMQRDLVTADAEKMAAIDRQRLLTSQKANLEEARATLSRRVSHLSVENERLERETQTLRSEVEVIRAEKLNSERLLTETASRVAKLTSLLEEARSGDRPINGSSSGLSCNSTSEDDRDEDRIKDVQINYSHCGMLANISAPETISQSKDQILHRAGVWMRDPLGAAGSKKVWVINQIGVKIKELYQYANLDDFRINKPEVVHTLPVPTESNGAVVYNGSLFFQRRNSRRIARYDIGTDNPIKDRSLKHAGFHGMFAYTWGGHTDIDFAVDETGLWVIYSTPKSRGKMLVTKINPKTLRAIRTIRTPIPKQKVANAFIICQTLYTVSDFKTRRISVNFSFNLKTRKLKRMNIPFISNYLFMTMIDYNPRDRHLYAWDNGRRVRYQVRLDDSMGVVRNGRIFPSNSTTT